jgi:hypothetical protein
LIDFRVISRVNGNRGIQTYEAEALKDVVWLGPNEKVKVLARWAPWDGVYSKFCTFRYQPCIKLTQQQCSIVTTSFMKITT